MSFTEEWRAIAGFEGCYEVSSLGHVRSVDRQIVCGAQGGGICTKNIKGRVLRPAKDRDGYLQLQLGRGIGRKVHHLVLEAFTGDRPLGQECAHLDGNRANNVHSNLKWATPLENASHKVMHGTLLVGSRHQNSKLVEADSERIRECSLFGAANVDLASIYGVHRATIADVVKGKTWLHI